jgi:hypothetical protein
VQVTSAARGCRLPRHMGNFIYDDLSFFRHSGDCHNVVQVLLLRHTEQLTQPSRALHTLCPSREPEWEALPGGLRTSGIGSHRDYHALPQSW